MISKNKFKWIAAVLILTSLPLKVLAGGFSFHLEIDFGNITLNGTSLAGEQTVKQGEQLLTDEPTVIAPEIETERIVSDGGEVTTPPNPEMTHTDEEKVKVDSDLSIEKENEEEKPKEILSSHEESTIFKREVKDFE